MRSLSARLSAVLAFAALTLAVASERARAIDPRFELDPRLLDGRRDAPRQDKGVKRAHKKEARAKAGVSEYTIRPGDHIFKILMRDYGLSNDEAEALIPEVKRLNDISDIRRLRVGQILRIPLVRGTGAGGGGARSEGAELPGRIERPAATTALSGEGGAPAAGHSLCMMSVAAPAEPDGVESARRLWDGLVPSRGEATQPITIEDKNFSLSLDPESFPTFVAADGGRVLVDAGGKIPPLVRAIIEQKDPSLRIVSESPRNRKRFMASLLAGARFYSVEENVALEFGTDPKLTINADFKIEKSPDSLLHQDVVLMNVGENRPPMPPSLVQFLGREGFRVLEPLSGRDDRVGRHLQNLYQITARDPRGIVDGVLQTLNIPFESNHNVELYGVADGGLRLNVRADRYFEEGGSRFVVSYFDGDPVTYTLTRLLETRGYRVVVLDPKDDFRKVSEKLFARMRIPGVFARHDLLSGRDASYGVQMSGFRLRSATGEQAFLTNTEIDPLFRDLLDANGYTIIAH
ncbi:LysM domain-containing protein [Geobacter sp.]|uniref:LysM peptidoglycan-binding domain-containing protein n=1 Tax=Geobacter sp. TaxID=46610 RepID=UPI002628C80F|nr:LysM domain-containing protein [Geobacter sp.]